MARINLTAARVFFHLLTTIYEGKEPISPTTMKDLLSLLDSARGKTGQPIRRLLQQLFVQGLHLIELDYAVLDELLVEGMEERMEYEGARGVERSAEELKRDLMVQFLGEKGESGTEMTIVECAYFEHLLAGMPFRETPELTAKLRRLSRPKQAGFLHPDDLWGEEEGDLETELEGEEEDEENGVGAWIGRFISRLAEPKERSILAVNRCEPVMPARAGILKNKEKGQRDGKSALSKLAERVFGRKHVKFA